MCHESEARIDPILGILPCQRCTNRPHASPHQQLEFTSESIRTQRKEFAKDILQPHRKGELSREYIEQYGTKRLIGYTKNEIENAKYVWGDLGYYKNV